MTPPNFGSQFVKNGESNIDQYNIVYDMEVNKPKNFCWNIFCTVLDSFSL